MNIKDLLEFKILETDKLTFTVYQLAVFILVLFTTWLVLKLIKKLLDRKIEKQKVDIGTRYAVFQIIKYFIWIIAIGVALETIGIRFNLLIASSAALLVGLGFGLQQIFSDYISGILILFEGNLKLNDVLQVE
ncbi:MAG: mechanosensitive ion channel [Bacteroidetes bacterium]|nr:mechanosensitive ion channel [Bacteroidota bacterium]MBL7105569.1 mechanosensitive ion channel [Bacteroidales bacterium]